LKVTHDGRSFTVDVAADGQGLVSHAGAGLLAEVADRVGLTRELSRVLAGVRERRGRHDPGRVIRDLAVMLADGGDCLSDLRAVRDQEPLFGPVASDSTAFRLIDRIANEPGVIDALRAARARARERAWELGARPERIVIDIDATLITAHTEKEGARVNFKGTFGFHPILSYLDHSHEALAGVLRSGNEGAHSAEAQIEVLDLALAQLPREVVSDLDTEIVMRVDSAGAAFDLCQAAQDAKIGFVVGFDLFQGVRESILSLPEDAWRPALRQDGEERDGAQVAEITHIERLDMTPWPDGSRVIVRRERPHPGAQLSFTDHEGHRFQATLTDLTGDMVEIERLHRGRANAEDRIRAAKQTGLENLPFREFDLNAVWLELSLIAQDLIAWTQTLCLDGELAVCEPKALRYRLLHTAARLSFHARRAVLRLQANWPWASQLAAAFTRLHALPPPAG
jgi:Transposase DDE domain group 1